MGNEIRQGVREALAQAALYSRALGKWLLLAGVTGGLCGLLGTAFHVAVEEVTALRGERP